TLEALLASKGAAGLRALEQLEIDYASRDAAEHQPEAGEIMQHAISAIAKEAERRYFAWDAHWPHDRLRAFANRAPDCFDTALDPNGEARASVREAIEKNIAEGEARTAAFMASQDAKRRRVLAEQL